MSDSMRKVDLLRAACCVAGADGEISEVEKSVLLRIAKQAGVGQASLDAMMECARVDDKYYATQFRIVVENPRDAMGLMFKMAIVDGRLVGDEVLVLRRLAERLDMSANEFDKWLQGSIDAARSKSSAD